MQDFGGDENFHVFSTDIKTHLVRDLTPFQVCDLPSAPRQRSTVKLYISANAIAGRPG
jgi:hypothetical protein